MHLETLTVYFNKINYNYDYFLMFGVCNFFSSDVTLCKLSYYRAPSQVEH